MIGRQLEYADTLPETWAVVPVGEIGTYLNGFAFKPEDWGTDGCPIIRIQNLNDRSKPFNYFAGQIADKYKIEDGDILVSWSASLGTFKWNRGEAWLNQHIFKAIPNLSLITRGFFYWVMVYAIKRIAENARGSTMKHVTGKEFKNSEVALPPLPEQKNIAHILSTVQRAIEAQEQIIQTTTELFKTMLHQLMTAQIRITNGHSLSDTEITQEMVNATSYPIPETWTETTIGEITVKTKQRDPRKIPADIFHYVDVSSVSNESFKITGASPTLGFDAPSRARKIIETNDVLFATVRPTLKRIALVSQEFNDQIASTGYCVLRSDKRKVDPRFLYYFLLTNHFTTRMAELERGANYPAVRDSDVKKSWIPLPPFPEQKKIAKILSTTQQKVDNAHSKKSKLKDLFHTLLHELMTGKIRVQTKNFSSPNAMYKSKTE